MSPMWTWRCRRFCGSSLAALAPDVQFMGEEQDNSRTGLEPPLLDPGPGGRHHQPDPQLPAQRRLPGPGGGWTNPSSAWYTILTAASASPPAGAAGPSETESPFMSAVSARLEDSLSVHGHRPRPPGAGGRGVSGRCGRCMTAARTCAAPAAPAWICAGWPAAGWTAMWSCLSSPGTTPPECCIVEEAGGQVTAPDGSPLSLCQGGPLLASNGRLHAALQSIS